MTNEPTTPDVMGGEPDGPVQSPGAAPIADVPTPPASDPAGPIGWERWAAAPADGEAALPTKRRSSTPATVLGIVLLAILTWANTWLIIRVQGVEDTPATFFMGYVMTLALVVGIIALIRWVVLKVTRRSTRVLSPWLVAGSVLLSGGMVVSNIGRLAPPPPVDAATVLAIDAPYVLLEPDEASLEQIETALGDARSRARSIAVRLIERDGIVQGYVIAADIAVRPAELEQFFAGLRKGLASTGTTGEVTTVQGHPAVRADLPDVGLAVVAWAEPPHLYLLYATTAQDAAAIAAAIAD